MFYTIYNDIHKFGPHEIDVEFEFKENHIYNGDIVDLGACQYKDLPKANEFLYNLIEKSNGNFISGNHEKMMEYLYLVKGHILFTHGDLIFKDTTSVKNFRWGREGSGWFRRCCVWIGSYLRRFLKKNRKISEKDMNEAVKWGKRFNCHTVVCGHKHPSKILKKSREGVILIVLPRGKNKIIL